FRSIWIRNPAPHSSARTVGFLRNRISEHCRLLRRLRVDTNYRCIDMDSSRSRFQRDLTHLSERTIGMPDNTETSSDQLLRMTAELAAAYVSNNSLAPSQLSETIKAIHRSLAGLSTGSAGAEAELPPPAVPIKKSVTPDYLVCLEDGKKQ